MPNRGRAVTNVILDSGTRSPAVQLQILWEGLSGQYRCRRHEKDKHGPRMRCSHCESFACPESRITEIKNHLRDEHGVMYGESPNKRRRVVAELPIQLTAPTIRVPPSPTPTMTMGSNTEDIGQEPDVTVEPADFVPSFEPTVEDQESISVLSISSYTTSCHHASLALSTDHPCSSASSQPSLPLPISSATPLPVTTESVQANSVPRSTQNLSFDFLLDEYGETSSPCNWLQALFPISEAEPSPNPVTLFSCNLLSISEAHMPVLSYLRSLGTRVSSGIAESYVPSGPDPNC